MLRFFAVFLLLLVGMLWIEIQPAVQQSVVMPFTAFLASISTQIILPFDASAIAYDNIIQNRNTGFGVAVLPGCNAVEACFILVAGILAFPAPWRLRFFGIVLGILAIQLLNIVRIISLFYIGQWNATAFEIAQLIYGKCSSCLMSSSFGWYGYAGPDKPSAPANLQPT